MSFWDLDSIRESERAATEARLADASREALVAEIVALRVAAYPLLATLSGLDMTAPRGVCASSKLFPSALGEGAERRKLAVHQEAGGFRYEPADPARLHELDYVESESIPLLNREGAPPVLHDDVTVLRVTWEGIGGGGPAGEISMGDVRRLAGAMRGVARD